MRCEDKLERIRQAVLNEGRAPRWHRLEVRRLRRDWPMLYEAVMATLTPAERRRFE